MCSLPGQLRRTSAALLALLWLALALQPLAHVGHGHRYCAEHQAFEELSGEVTSAPPAPSVEDEALQAAPAASSVAVHLACAAPVGPARAVLPAPAGLELRAPVPVLVQREAAPRAAGGVALLRVAPKGSPPRA